MTFVFAILTIISIIVLRHWADRHYSPAELRHLARSEKRTKIL